MELSKKEEPTELIEAILTSIDGAADGYDGSEPIAGIADRINFCKTKIDSR